MRTSICKGWNAHAPVKVVHVHRCRVGVLLSNMIAEHWGLATRAANKQVHVEEDFTTGSLNDKVAHGKGAEPFYSLGQGETGLLLFLERGRLAPCGGEGELPSRPE
jgi:hypothetical protein